MKGAGRSLRAKKAGSLRRPTRGKTKRSTRGYRSQKRGGTRLRIRIIRGLAVLFSCAVVAALGLTAGGYLGLVKSVSRLDTPLAAETHPTYIYSVPIGESGDSRRVIGTIFGGENRKTASLEEMPPSLLNALVAKEDERFMQHGGVDLWGITRALWVDLRAGETVEGASTITQQYVRNAYLSQEVSITRKVKEALISIQLETQKEKDEILADYLNIAYFGSNAYGVEAASETYFNKSVDDLTVAESATLVGLVWSPSTLGQDKQAAKEQRDLVLEKMFGAGYINRQDYAVALEEPMPEEWPQAPMRESGLTGPELTRDFAEHVEGELVERYGTAAVYRGGLEVYTTLDLEDQQAAREVLYGPTGYLPDSEDPDAALISVEPDTGRIKAMVGNRDPSSHFNLVTQGRRQPGSSFKLFALIAALELGIDPDTKFISENKVYEVPMGNGETERWEVENYEKEERGSISLREALWQSDNTVYTDLIMDVGDRGLKNGPEAMVDVAKRLGVTADYGSSPPPSVILGTKEVSPLQMASAYATIANGGRRLEPTAITKVVRNGGRNNEEVLYEHRPEDGKQVIEPEIAAETVEIMTGDITHGIAREASLGTRLAAGKTGTSENFFDSWFVGFTPQLSTAVWMGYAEGGETLEPFLSSEGSGYGTIGSPEEVWRDYMLRVLAGEPVERFEGQGAAARNRGRSAPGG